MDLYKKILELDSVYEGDGQLPGSFETNNPNEAIKEIVKRFFPGVNAQIPISENLQLNLGPSVNEISAGGQFDVGGGELSIGGGMSGDDKAFGIGFRKEFSVGGMPYRIFGKQIDIPLIEGVMSGQQNKKSVEEGFKKLEKWLKNPTPERWLQLFGRNNAFGLQLRNYLLGRTGGRENMIGNVKGMPTATKVFDAINVKKLLTPKQIKKINEFVEKMTRLGVWDENVVASELKAVVNQIRNNTINTTDKLFDKLVKMAPTDKVARLYAGGDNLWKGYGYNYSRGQLSQALKNIEDVKEWFRFMGQPFDEVNATTGVKKTFDDALDEAAAYLLRNTYPTYSKVPPSIQNLRKLPVGAFISFPAEIIRTSANIMSIGLKEAGHSNPYIRQMGLRRLLGFGTTSFAIGKGVTEIAQFLTGTSSTQWDAYKRSGAAVWDSRSKLIPIEGWTNGESAAINFSYFSPYDVLQAPFNAALAKAREQNLNPQETEKYVLDLMFAEEGPVMTLLEPFITEPIGFDRLIDVTTRNGRKDQGGTVYSASDDLGDKIVKSLAYILDGVQPGVTKSFDKI